MEPKPPKPPKTPKRRRANRVITPVEIQRALAVFAETGTYSDAAAAIGRDPAAVRRALLRAHRPDRAALHAMALEEAEIENRRILIEVRNRLKDYLKDANTRPEVSAIAQTLHENAKIMTQLRMNQAKLMGAVVERHDVTSGGSPLTVIVPPEQEPEGEG